MLMVSLTYILVIGVGIWGITIPIGWGFAIINFVWWIGIGHAGTLDFRNLVVVAPAMAHFHHRFAEAMTLSRRFPCGIISLLHMGTSLAGILVSYPDTMKLWPNFRSPLVWDALRGFHLRHGIAAVLVHWFDP